MVKGASEVINESHTIMHVIGPFTIHSTINDVMINATYGNSWGLY